MRVVQNPACGKRANGHRISILRSANLPEERKTAAIKKQQDHLQLVQKERAVYNEMTAACKKTCDDYQLSIGPSPPSSKKIGLHYSFDFAQQLLFNLIPVSNCLLCAFINSFDAKRPGVVLARTHSDAEPVSFQLLCDPEDLPPVVCAYYTARELFLEVLDIEAIQELTRRSAGVKAGAQRRTHSLSKERSVSLSHEEYSEALTLFSIVLQSGLSLGDSCTFGSELTLKLDRQQGVLKRNSIQTHLLSLTRLKDEHKLEALSAFCKHLSRRYQTLHTPGPNLAVKKYRLSYQHSVCSLNLALLCDSSSGFICNMYLYSPEQLQKQSNKPVVEQVVKRLVEPFRSQRHIVQLDNSAWKESRIKTILSGLEVNIHFTPSAKMLTIHPSSSPSISDTSEDSKSELIAHIQGWTGPALFPLSDLKGPGADAFMPGFWATLHMVCINTYVLHSLQNQGSGRNVFLTGFTRVLAAQLATDNSMAVPVLPVLNSCSYQKTMNLFKQRLVMFFHHSL
ncbi:hypothetical protein XENOCAPTIV_019356 [Xenoophorus captivus]|uniref:PiggyBac transposable element-derived protein domain-containing protein n=1 Tax=Xenoophorus captivus TaxID=1517983 RepID=A0ABV0R1A9_9TELE